MKIYLYNISATNSIILLYFFNFNLSQAGTIVNLGLPSSVAADAPRSERATPTATDKRRVYSVSFFLKIKTFFKLIKVTHRHNINPHAPDRFTPHGSVAQKVADQR